MPVRPLTKSTTSWFVPPQPRRPLSGGDEYASQVNKLREMHREYLRANP
jgi:hypothetical protein